MGGKRMYCNKDNYKNYGYYKQLKDQVIGWYLCSSCDHNERNKKKRNDENRRKLNHYGIRKDKSKEGMMSPIWKSWFDEEWPKMKKKDNNVKKDQNKENGKSNLKKKK